MIDGIDAEKLNAEDIFGLLTAEDEKFIGQLGKCDIKFHRETIFSHL